jgi:hypothetical protein
MSTQSLRLKCTRYAVMNALPEACMQEGLQIVFSDDKKGLIVAKRGFGFFEAPAEVRFQMSEGDGHLLLRAESRSWLGPLAFGSEKRLLRRLMSKLEEDL